MKKFFTIIYLLSGILQLTLAQWELRYPPQPTAGINDMCFLNPSTGFAVNNAGSILKTTDGGLHWTIFKHYQRDLLLEIKFADDQNGFCISPYSFIGDKIDFIYTTNGGDEWQSTGIGISDALTFLPLSISEIIKSGDQGTISRLDNFFGLWSERYRIPQYFNWDIFVPYGDIRQFEKLNSGRILALGSSWRAFQANVIQDSVAFLLYSDDNGITWDTLWCDLPKILTTISFSDNNIGWMGGAVNEIYKTTDGGVNWQLIYFEENPDITTSISKIKAISSSKVFAVTTKGKIILTTDSGFSWDTTSIAPYSYYESFYNIYFSTDQTGFILGPDLWITTTGGNSWNKIDDSIKPSFSKIQFLNTSIGYGIGGDNYYGGSSFYRTIDGGYSWTKLYQGNPNSSFNGFFMMDTLNGWLTEFNTLFKTSDGGITWSAVSVDTLLEFIRGVEFFNSELGVLFEVRQRFNNYLLNYVTTDGGSTWQKYQMSEQPYLSSFLKIKRTDPSHIWVVNQQGVWLSSDTAKSWVNISTEVEGWAGAFDFLDSLNGWAAHLDGQQDKVKYTTDGGLTWSTMMKPYMVQSQDLVIEGRNYFGRIQVTVAGLYGSIFRYEEGWSHAYQEKSYANNWLLSIAVHRESNRIHKWIAGTGGTILYTNEYITDLKKEELNLQEEFRLYQNYPNPFNPTTKIKYIIPASVSPIWGGERGVFVTLKVYDILGKEIQVLVNEEKAPGTYEVELNAKNLPSGIYFVKFTAENFSSVKKMVLAR